MTADERIGEPEGGWFRGPLARGHDGDLLADEVSGDRGRGVKAILPVTPALENNCRFALTRRKKQPMSVPTYGQ